MNTRCSKVMCWIVGLGIVLLSAVVGSAQVAQPAQAAADQDQAQDQEQNQDKNQGEEQGLSSDQARGHEEKKAEPAPATAGRMRSYEAPAIYETVVKGRRLLHEDELIGEYRQPRWTAARRFPTTRIYVVPDGTLQFEWWFEGKWDLKGDNPTRMRSMYEFEFGLGHRLQLDLYLVTQQEGLNGPLRLYEEKGELRWALADWGVIPANPTLYVEAVRENGGPFKLEGKLLLGDQITSGWYWGANLVVEHELTGDERANEYTVTGAVAHSLVDQVFSLGLEVKGEMVDVDGARFAFDNWEILGGPSIQWRPTPPFHLDLVALFGAEFEKGDDGSETTPLAEPTIVLGYEF
jgi:hypothetical protein